MKSIRIKGRVIIEMDEVIISNGASVKDAIPIDKLDEFYKKWSIGEPFVRDYKA